MFKYCNLMHFGINVLARYNSLQRYENSSQRSILVVICQITMLYK